ncbi:MAG: hypothetical protein WC568_01500 [Candidatus Methanoperedens sp.]
MNETIIHANLPKKVPTAALSAQAAAACAAFSNDVVREVLVSLGKSKGSSPAQLAVASAISSKKIVESIGELDKIGLVEKDEKEIKDFGEEWAFYKLKPEGYRIITELEQLGSR